MQLVRRAASRTLNYADTLPNCLRAAFHDAAERDVGKDAGGANGSLMQELDDPFTYPDNLGVAICHSYMKVFVPDMRSQGCPNLTFADAIQWVGGVAVEMAGGPAVPLLPGRRDCGCFDNSTVLPDECSTLEELAHFWGQRGFAEPVKAAVVLNGGHNLGNVRSTVPHNTASGTGFGGAGPNCIGAPGPMTAQPNLFDSQYYNELYTFTGRAGYLFSDRALVTPSNITATDLVKLYMNDKEAFFNDWTNFIQEMSLIGVDPKPAKFGVHDGFLPGGPIGRVPPMTPEEGNGYAGTGANYTGAIVVPRQPLLSEEQGSRLANTTGAQAAGAQTAG
ncbi:hypothetical protein WJX75_001354 [Coccomyxa subellipsoidea]|uniref:Plant heme peroxidase family profile domain-containing protein n=1 Tax=Coccomyxa subellipsoidea TaxID=248742 RepID=A0ABR2YZQ6_9CHLO